MLVLTRKQSETIQIGDSITITVLRMKGKAVRLGIKAPHDLNVIRGELAFECPEEHAADSEAEGTEVAEVTAAPRLRNNAPRRDSSWSPSSATPASLKASCSAAWSI